MQSKLSADQDDNGSSAAAPPPAKGAEGEEADRGKEYENWQLTDEEWAQIASQIAEAIEY